MKKHSDEVIVIGAGLGGLAAACTLGARGYRVRVLETNRWVGGKAAVHEEAGFRFDMGPTILTMPSVLRRIFAEAKAPIERYLDLVRLDPQWRSFFENGRTLDLVADVDQMAGRIDDFTGNTSSGRGFVRFMDLARKQAEVSDRAYFWRPIANMLDIFKSDGRSPGAGLADLVPIRIGRTVSEVLRSHVGDAGVCQMLDHFTQYVGSSPELSPAVLCGIAHMQSSEGVWYPMGGISTVPQALRKFAMEHGVEFESGVSVRRICVEDGRVTGVETDHVGRIPAGAVVSNRDSVRTYRELLGGEYARRFDRRSKVEAACSGVVLYLGLKKRYEHLLHHNFVFSRDPHEEFEAIYRRGCPAPDPTCYVCAPSGTDPEVAPEGGEALYVLVHAPYVREGHDWKAMLPGYRKVILEKLKSVAGLGDIEERIVCERILTPEDIGARYQTLNGAIYGLASHGRFSGTLKPGNRCPDIEGLYLGGGSAHPGPGMPMALMSGWIGADALDADGLVEKAGAFALHA